MIKRGMKKGFTLVELLVAVAIIALLSGAAYIGIQRSQARGMNERMADDLTAIANALEQYKQDSAKNMYPNIADGSLKLAEAGGNSNVNCFTEDTTYIHDCAATTAAFIQTQVDNVLLTKRYLQEVPTDPRTGSRYVYGVSTDGQYYQVAGNWLNEDGSYKAKVVGNLKDGYSLLSLIRAYDGPNFVMDGEGYLPYSPDHLAITARIEEVTGTGAVTVDGLHAGVGTVLKAGSRVKAPTGVSVVLYFSDGSISYLDGTTDPKGAELWVLPNTEVEKNNKDGIITKIRLKIFSGKIWNKVARLAKESEFNVETTGAIAGVRGTEFGIDATGTQLIVLNGAVAARLIKLGDANISVGTGTDSYIDFDSTQDISNLQVAHGNGDLANSFFEPPVAEGPGSNMATSGALLDVEEQHRIENYYRETFNNNMRPRILKIDTTSPTPYIEFHLPLPDNLYKIIACPATEGCSPVSEWTIDSLNEWKLVKDTIEGKTTIDPSKMEGYNGNTPNLVHFRFEDRHGNRTAFSDPVVDVRPSLLLTENEIYNLLAESDEELPIQNDIQIFGTPSSMPITSSVNISCNKLKCDWSITGIGIFGLTYVGVPNVIYYPMDSNLDMDNKIAFVSGHFDNKDTVPVQITCAETGNPSNSTTAKIDIIYEPFKISSKTNYQYSWSAKGGMNWNQAKTYCGNLAEGTFIDWHLPVKTVYNTLPTTQDKIDEAVDTWCGIFTSKCPNMPTDANSTWLQDAKDGSNAYLVQGNNPGAIAYDLKTALYGFRCVRP